MSDSLKAIHTLKALQDAIRGTGKEDLKGLIHHSDRGTQYYCKAYVEELGRRNISISMTEDYKPTKNTITERINDIIKQELIYKIKRFKNGKEAQERIGRFIVFYNEKRPHMSVVCKRQVVCTNKKEYKRNVRKIRFIKKANSKSRLFYRFEK